MGENLITDRYDYRNCRLSNQRMAAQLHALLSGLPLVLSYYIRWLYGKINGLEITRLR